MDEDPFDASVWSTSAASTSKPPISTASVEESHAEFAPAGQEDAFDDDFDDFGAPAAPALEGETASFADDFGDFGETIEAESVTFVQTEQPEPSPLSASTEEYHAIVLDPMPSREELERQIDALIAPIFPIDTGQFTDEPVREVAGLGQMLITQQSRDLYRTLTEIPPDMTRLVNWTRSRIRREQLIALGVPVNLDEVLPTSNAKPLPPLHITTSPAARPASAPPGRPATPAGLASRAATPVGGGRTPRSGPPPLGPAPKVDMAKAEDVLRATESQMSILPLMAVESQLADIRTVTEQANALLAHLLQSRDVLQQDSETYNRLIAELVGEAQKAKMPASRWGRRREKSSSTMSGS
ncbi:hypothetical protein DACRYDRAFT_19532 [Dacryopinax primogenitus]|uniref:Uncharacterized protein n=1 Tax=Dacryopinax primogenitus (strain DJM 731) TaxID=1858805 RepID=M5GFI6_DACPD|nr:uncharacterized protein DACRYDRAFT_19532 [Dacryopinax primogenitus]EJU06337.1 hypothetical protein DACRYDRAFT_19532 [Dacryopinax primogenitus]